MVSLGKFQGRLFRKYVVIFVFVISGALLTSGLVQLYFAYQETQTAVVGLQRGAAAAAASKIEQFIEQTERQIGWVIPLSSAAGSVTADQRRNDYLKLLRQAPGVSQVSYLDASGRQQLRVARPGVDATGDQGGQPQETVFREVKAGTVYFGPPYFRNGSEPYMTMALAEAGDGAGVTVAEVDLKPVWDVISQVRIGQSGYAYVVDSGGRLIAHPDIDLVLQQTDLSLSPQVQAARSGTLQGRQRLGSQEAVDLLGQSVLVVSQI